MSSSKEIKQCPWIGPVPCEERDAKRFYGRNKELRELLPKVRTQRLTILSADSGVGKTSLVNAGLIPSLRILRERDSKATGFALCLRNWATITTKPKSLKTEKDPTHVIEAPARVMANTIAESLDDLKIAASKQDELLGIVQLNRDLDVLSAIESVEGMPGNSENELKKLRAYLRRLRDALQGKQIVLIVDQAEEFMGSGVGSDQQNRHLEPLNVLAALLQMQGIRIVISLRVEYMGKLRTLEDQFPPLAPRVYHLRPLTWGVAREAILRSANEDTDVDISRPEIDRLLEWVTLSQHNDLLPIDMLAVQALLLDLYRREDQKVKKERQEETPHKRLRIDGSYLNIYWKDLLLEEPRLHEQGSHFTVGPMLRWIDSAFERLDKKEDYLIPRIAANMGTVLSTPRGFKSHVSEGDLIYHSIRKDLPMSAKENVNMINVYSTLKTGDKLTTKGKFPRLAVEMSDAASEAVNCLIEGNILKRYGSDEHGSPIYSLQHDGYTPALTEWCEDPRRRENDSLAPRVGVYGIQIRRVTFIENRILKEVIWEGCDIREIKSKNVTFYDCKFTGSYLDDCEFDNCEFHDCKFDGTVFFKGKFKNVEFIDCAARGMVAKKMEWHNVVFHDCNLTSAVTEDITLDKCLQIEDCKALYTQIYSFKTTTPERVFDITIKGCDLHGALFEDYDEQDTKRFSKCNKNVTVYITQAPNKS